jgi:hypothetical protein
MVWGNLSSNLVVGGAVVAENLAEEGRGPMVVWLIIMKRRRW